jgi:hypothetical protein
MTLGGLVAASLHRGKLSFLSTTAQTPSLQKLEFWRGFRRFHELRHSVVDGLIMMSNIEFIQGRQILDSRGNPTVETEVVLSSDDPSTRAELLLLSPSFLVPCLRHEGATVWDTLAIGDRIAPFLERKRLIEEPDHRRLALVQRLRDFPSRASRRGMTAPKTSRYQPHHWVRCCHRSLALEILR